MNFNLLFNNVLIKSVAHRRQCKIQGAVKVLRLSHNVIVSIPEYLTVVGYSISVM